MGAVLSSKMEIIPVEGKRGCDPHHITLPSPGDIFACGLTAAVSQVVQNYPGLRQVVFDFLRYQAG
jgi:hypothetical protein